MDRISRLRRRRVMIPAAIIAGLVVLYAAAGFLLAPYLVERYLPEYVATRLDRGAAVERVVINPFTFTIDADGLVLSERDGRPLASVGALHVNFDPTARVRGPWTIASVRIVSPDLHFEIDAQGGLNVAALARDLAPTHVASDDAEGGGAELLLRNLIVEGGTVTLTDLRPSQPASVRLDAVRVTLQDVGTMPGRAGGYQLETGLPDGGALRMHGSLTLAPLASAGRVDIAELDVATVWQFLRDALRIDQPSGRLYAEAQYALRLAGDTLEASATGVSIGLNQVELRQRGAASSLLALRQMKLEGGSFDFTKREARAALVALQQGGLTMSRDERGNLDWQQLTVEAQTGEPSALDADKPWEISLDAVRLSQLDFSYRDATRTRALAVDAKALNATLSASAVPSEAGQRVRVQRIDAGAATLRMAAEGDAEPLLALDGLSVSGGQFDSSEPALTAASIEASGGSARVIRSAAGQLSFAQAFSAKRAEPSTGTPMRVAIGRAAIAGFDVFIADESGAEPLEYTLAAVAADVGNYDTRPGKPVTFEAKAAVKAGGTLALKGSIGAARERVEGTLEISDLALAPVARRLTAGSGIRIGVGGFSTTGSFALDIGGEAARFDYKGSARLAGPTLDAMATDKDALSLETRADALTTEGNLTVTASDPIRVRYEGKSAIEDVTARQPRSKDGSGALALALARVSAEGLLTADSTGALRYDGRARIASPKLGDGGRARLALEAADVTAEGQLARTPGNDGSLRFEGKAGVNGIRASQTAGESGGGEELSLQVAAVSAAGALSISPGGALRFEGQAAADEAELRSPDVDEPLAAWKRLAVMALRFGLNPDTLVVKETRLDSPRARILVLEDRSLELANRLARVRGEGGRDEAARENRNTRDAEPFPVDLERVRVTDGVVNFTDRSLVLPFSTVVSELSGSISGFDTAGDRRADVSLEGRAAEHGLARAKGSVNLVEPAAFTDLTVTFRNVPMPELSPYVATFAGRKIASGRLALDLRYAIRDGALLGDNDIVLDEFRLGERVESPSAADLPLDLAVALLKDADGKIRAEVPVRGDLRKPDFDIGALIGKAIGNLIGGIVSAPFRALGALFGAGENAKLDRVTFDPGSARLLPPAEEKLGNLAASLKQRPQLKLMVQGRYDPALDQKALRKRAVQHAVAERLGEKTPSDVASGPIHYDGAETQRVLRTMLAEREGPNAIKALADEFRERPEGAPAGRKAEGRTQGVPELPRGADFYRMIEERLVQLQPLPTQALETLASSRARVIVEYLQHEGGLADARVGTVRPSATEASDSDEGVTAKLDLEAAENV